MENLTKSQTEHHHSTYQLLVESEETQRNAFESVVYLILIAAIGAAMWQFSHQLATFTNLGMAASQNVAVETVALHG